MIYLRTPDICFGVTGKTRVRKVMVYFCYIHRDTDKAPYFEVLPETSEVDAIGRATQMLSQHAGAVRAEVWDGDSLLFSLPRTNPGAAARPAASRPSAS